MIEGWTTVSSTIVFTGARVRVHRDSVRRSDESLGTYEYTESADGVRVVALDGRGRIALVSENVYVCGQRLLMCPGGGCEVGEDPLAAAQRELAEEAGIHAGEVEPLTMMWRMPAGARTREHLFLAQGLKVGEHHRDASEADMELCWVPFDQAVDMCSDGRITEAGSLAAIMLTALRLQRTEAQPRPRQPAAPPALTPDVVAQPEEVESGDHGPLTEHTTTIRPASAMADRTAADED